GAGRTGRDATRAAGREGGAGARPGAAARPGTRPGAAVAARPTRTAAATRSSGVRRMAALGVIAVVLAVLLAPAVRTYVAQRSQVQALTEQVAAQQGQVEDLRRQRASWDDPAYVKAQARERLKFVMPGDRAYTVIAPEPAPVTPVGAQQVAAPPASDQAWFGDLWGSLQAAGAGTPSR
ncbi:MAG TPA: septum formation initiator family protein, partial [Actinomycetales bacterium]